MSLAPPPVVGPRAGGMASVRDFVDSAFHPRTLRVWGVKSAVSVLDQGLSSFASFVANLLLARWMKPEVYGAFAVVFAVYLFLTGFHNVLLLEPMSVFGPARYRESLPTYFRAQIRLHLCLTGGLAAVLLIVALGFAVFASGSLLIAPSIAGGICLPALLMILLLRRMCYITQRPQEAVYGSSLYLGLILLGLFLLRFTGGLRPAPVFFLMGLASLLAAIVVALRLGLFGQMAASNEVRLAAIVRENWEYGRWLVASTLLWSIATQAQVFLVAAILGLGASGILRAMQLPSLVLTQVNTAMGLLVLPALSFEFGLSRPERLRHKALLVTLGLSGIAVVFVLSLAFLAVPIERVFFGGKYALYSWLIPVLALAPAATAPAVGFSMALRAARKTHYDLIANAVAAVLGLASAIIFMRFWGLAGAAVSMVVALSTYTIVYGISYRRSIRPTPEEDSLGSRT